VARLAFTPDSNFFRKIAIASVENRAVAADLERHEHEVVELAQRSTDAKLWKDGSRPRAAARAAPR
jgi:hypothetical protein